MTLVVFRWQAGDRERISRHDAAPKQGEFVDAGDVEIFVQEMGPAKGPAVLFIHGTAAWSESWREPMAVLASQGFHTIALDLPPFGFSQRPEDGTYDRDHQASRIIGVLDALHITNAILVGHSIGSGPTLQAALNAPQKVRALILVDAALNLNPKGIEKNNSWMLQPLLSFKPLRDALVASSITNPLFTRWGLQQFVKNPAVATPERVALYQQPFVVIGTTSAVSDWVYYSLFDEDTSSGANPAYYTKLQMPVHIIWGEDDTTTPLSHGEYLATLIPGATLTTLKNVGHIPQIEDTAQFITILLGLLNEKN